MDGGISSDYLHSQVGGVLHTNTTDRTQQIKNVEQQKAEQTTADKTLQDDVVTISQRGQTLAALQEREEKEPYRSEAVQETAADKQAVISQTQRNAVFGQEKSEDTDQIVSALKEDTEEDSRSILNTAPSAKEEGEDQTASAADKTPRTMSTDTAADTAKSAYQAVEESTNNNSQATEHEIDEVA